MAPPARLTESDLAAVDDLLVEDDAARRRAFPGAEATRQPVHTVYVPADRCRPDVIDVWSDQARALLRLHGPDPASFAAATGQPVHDVAAIWDALLLKLDTAPIEDLRIDLEDGYGTRSDAEEDRDAIHAGEVLAGLANATAPQAPGATARTAPGWLGVRIKSLEAPTRRRGLRTLDLVLGALLERTGLPPGWVITVPKVTSVGQVRAMVDICQRLERAHDLMSDSLRFELQIETSQAVLLPDGTAGVAPMIHAAGARCSGLHFGTYDYTAAVGIAGRYQSLEHPAADHAKAVIQLAAAGTGVRISDGSSNVLPTGDHDQVVAAWRLHARLVRRSLERGFYQGWDLHPGQLPTRFLATYLFFRDGFASTARRLADYRSGIGAGTQDEPATVRALAEFLLRGLHCGALLPAEVEAATAGLGADDLRDLTRSGLATA